MNFSSKMLFANSNFILDNSNHGINVDEDVEIFKGYFVSKSYICLHKFHMIILPNGNGYKTLVEIWVCLSWRRTNPEIYYE